MAAYQWADAMHCLPWNTHLYMFLRVILACYRFFLLLAFKTKMPQERYHYSTYLPSLWPFPVEHWMRSQQPHKTDTFITKVISDLNSPKINVQSQHPSLSAYLNLMELPTFSLQHLFFLHTFLDFFGSPNHFLGALSHILLLGSLDFYNSLIL